MSHQGDLPLRQQYTNGLEIRQEGSRFATENDTGRESPRFLLAQLAGTRQVSFSSPSTQVFDPLRHRRR
jgi:hypothetical protein